MSRNELSQTDALELRNSGADYLMLGQYENASKHFMESLKYEPNNTLTLRLLADVNQYVNILDMNGYQIGDTGATALAKALESNSSLTFLNLHRNQIGETGAVALAKALESTSSLTSLDLKDNQI